MSALAGSTGFALALTLGAWLLGQWPGRARPRWSALLNPVLLGSMIVVAVLVIARVDYSVYRGGVRPLVDLLGPAVVALGVPVHRHRHVLRSVLPMLVVASAVGALIGMAVSVSIGALLGAEHGTLFALATAHTTSPVAFALVSGQGGPGGMAVVFAIASGILGAVATPAVLRVLRITDDRAIGYALGSVTHAIGTSRALQLGDLPGALAGVGMAVSAVVVSAAVPLLLLIPAVRAVVGV